MLLLGFVTHRTCVAFISIQRGLHRLALTPRPPRSLLVLCKMMLDHPKHPFSYPDIIGVAFDKRCVDSSMSGSDRLLT